MGDTTSKISKSRNQQADEEETEMDPQDERRQEKNRALVRKKLQSSDLRLNSTQLDEMVLDLSDHKRMKEKYFHSILKGMDDAVALVVEEREAHADGIRNRKEMQMCDERIATELNNVQEVEVELALCELNGDFMKMVASAMHKLMKPFDYGPHHAALVIGGVALEWDNSSLVIPRRATAEHDWAFKRNVHQPVVGSENPLKDLPLRDRAKTGQHFDTIVEKITNIKMEKEQLVDELVAVAVRYNTKHVYRLFSHNCQHFVRDCLHVIGITDKEEVFSDRLKGHEAVLDKEGLKGSTCEEFESHQDLNDYVRKNLRNMNQSELELCLSQYVFFHAFHNASPKEAWQCQEDKCLQSQVEKKLQDSKPTELK